MECTHPIDAEIRAKLLAMKPNQSDLAAAIGHTQSWLSKYMAGKGHATIDDLIRIAAHLLGVNLPILTETESRVLAIVQGLGQDDQQEVLAYAALRKKLAQPGRLTESSEPAPHTPQATVRKERGRR